MSMKSFHAKQTLKTGEKRVHTGAYRRVHRRASLAFAVAFPFILLGCQAEVIRHGHIMQEEDLQQVQVGMGRDQVLLALGTPDTQSTVGQGAIYYISTTTKRQLAFLDPKVVDRRVVAVYFDKNDRVEQIANYGMKDGKVFDFIKRETPAYSRDEGLIRSLFRNIGRPGAGAAVPGQ